MRSFDPPQESVQNIYKLMIGAIVPRPIAFVSSLDVRGVRNLAPFSFFNGVSADPPVVLFCASVRREDPQRGVGPHKDTLLNVIATREFVINVVTESIAEKMNLTSAQVPPDVDEFELSGLTPLPSELVKPPRVAESPVQMECRLRQIVKISERFTAARLCSVMFCASTSARTWWITSASMRTSWLRSDAWAGQRMYARGTGSTWNGRRRS